LAVEYCSSPPGSVAQRMDIMDTSPTGRFTYKARRRDFDNSKTFTVSYKK